MPPSPPSESESLAVGHSRETGQQAPQVSLSLLQSVNRLELEECDSVERRGFEPQSQGSALVSPLRRQANPA